MISNKCIAALVAVTLVLQTVEAMHKPSEETRLKLLAERQGDHAVPILLHQTLKGHTDTVNSLASFTFDGRHYIVSGSADKTVRVWDLERLECIHVFEGHTDYIWSLCIVPTEDNDVLIVSGSNDCDIRVWSFKYKKCIKTLKGHSARVSIIKLIDPAACIIASCSDDMSVKVWDLYNFTCLKTVYTEGKFLIALERLEDHVVAAADYDSGSIYILDLVEGKCLRTIQSSNQQVICMKAMTDDRLLVWDYGCVVYNWKTGEECYSFISPGDQAFWGIQSMVTCPDHADQIILEHIEGYFYVYDYNSGELKAVMTVSDFPNGSFQGGFFRLTVIDGKLAYSSCLAGTDPDPNNIYISPYVR